MRLREVFKKNMLALVVKNDARLLKREGSPAGRQALMEKIEKLLLSKHSVIIVLMEIDTTHFKEKLEEEMKILEGELERIGRRNPSNPDDWEPKPPDTGVPETDKNSAADRVEAFEENSAVLKELEARYNNVKLALKKIEEDVYGKCEIGNEEIKVERLEANPAARTCTTHINHAVE